MCRLAAAAIAKAVDFLRIKLTRELVSEDHVTFLHLKCILTKKEKEEIEQTKGGENRVRKNQQFQECACISAANSFSCDAGSHAALHTDRQEGRVLGARVPRESQADSARRELCGDGGRRQRATNALLC